MSNNNSTPLTVEQILNDTLSLLKADYKQEYKAYLRARACCIEVPEMREASRLHLRNAEDIECRMISEFGTDTALTFALQAKVHEEINRNR